MCRYIIYIFFESMFLIVKISNVYAMLNFFLYRKMVYFEKNIVVIRLCISGIDHMKIGSSSQIYLYLCMLSVIESSTCYYDCCRTWRPLYSFHGVTQSNTFSHVSSRRNPVLYDATYDGAERRQNWTTLNFQSALWHILSSDAVKTVNLALGCDKEVFDGRFY